MLFMIVGSFGYAKLLQPAMDHSNSGARNQLYGRSSMDADGNKKPYAKPEKRRMRTLEEEYERSKKDWEENWEMKPVPKPANAPKVR
jgi:hypothetical protein